MSTTCCAGCSPLRVVVLAALGDGTGAATHAIEGIAFRIVREPSRPGEVNGVEIEIASSIGVAIAPPDTDLDVLVASADAAMSEAKRAGDAAHRISVVDQD